jgi:hypothetical protein
MNVRSKTPRTTPPSSSFTPDLHSYSYIIRDGWLQRIKAVPTFQNIKKFGTTKMNRIQVDQLPFLGVYFLDEQTRADGDWDAGAPHFVVDLKLGFSVIVESSDETVAENNLDSAFWTLINMLSYQYWFRFPMPPGTVDAMGKPCPFIDTEGVTRGQRFHKFGNAGINNETPVAELQFDMTLRYHEYFSPWPFDDLKTMHVTVAHPWPYDPDANVPPFTVQYDIPIEGEFSPQPGYDLKSPEFARPVLTVV